MVDGSGRRVAGFPADAFARITEGRYASLPRGELAAAIFGLIEGRVETIFGDGVAIIEQSNDAARVTFERGPAREFDLVIGADGLHSRVREIAFGDAGRFERSLGYKAAAFELPDYRPRDELVYVMYTEVGRQAARFSMRDDRTMFLFTYAAPSGPDSAPKEELRRRFGSGGWECPQILARLDEPEQFYFDEVSQVRMGAERGAWIRGRVDWWATRRLPCRFWRGRGRRWR